MFQSLQVVGTLIVSKIFRFYPPGGFLNMINQPQVQGENLHLVGQAMTFNPMSSPPPVNAYGTGMSSPPPVKTLLFAINRLIADLRMICWNIFGISLVTVHIYLVLVTIFINIGYHL